MRRRMGQSLRKQVVDCDDDLAVYDRNGVASTLGLIRRGAGEAPLVSTPHHQHQLCKCKSDYDEHLLGQHGG